MLIADFFNTFFALDSKFAKSFWPFLFRPGSLTNLYVSGKRMTYAHPLRLYLIASLFFFFVFTLASKKSIEDDENEGIIRTTYSLENVRGLDSANLAELTRILDKDRLREIEKDLEGRKMKNLREALEENLTREEKERLKQALDSGTLQLLRLIPALEETDADDTIRQVTDAVTIRNDPNDLEESPSEKKSDNGDGFFEIFNQIDWELINELKDNRKISDDQVYDSLHLENVSDLQEHVVRQLIRVNRADEELFAEFILKNLPLMMLILIPVFALVLKLLYIRRKHLYINHLIHALHLHSFAYLFYGVSLIIILYIINGEDSAAVFGFVGFLVVSTYAFISFLRVYKQHWFKTLIKFNITGYIYVVCILIFFLTELVISFLLY